MADTPATIFLKARKVAYTEQDYGCVEYVEHGGRRCFLVGISPAEICKTLTPQLVDVAPED